MKSLIRISNGYRLIYKPNHPAAMKGGNWGEYIYEHRYFAELSLGRYLKNNEIVHHLDGNRKNNRIENLLILERGQHVKLHSWLDSGAFIHESYERNGVNSENSRRTEPTFCFNCGLCLQLKQKHCCSEECYHIFNRKVPERPSYIQLIEDLKNNSFVAIGKRYNVSDNCIRKWLRKYETTLSQAGSTLPEGAETTGEV